MRRTREGGRLKVEAGAHRHKVEEFKTALKAAMDRTDALGQLAQQVAAFARTERCGQARTCRTHARSPCDEANM